MNNNDTSHYSPGLLFSILRCFSKANLLTCIEPEELSPRSSLLVGERGVWRSPIPGGMVHLWKACLPTLSGAVLRQGLGGTRLLGLGSFGVAGESGLGGKQCFSLAAPSKETSPRKQKQKQKPGAVPREWSLRFSP